MEGEPRRAPRADPGLDRDAFVTKRLKYIEYMRRVHDEEAFWMNCARITKADVLARVDAATLLDRTRTYFDLGLNLGRLLTLPSGVQVVRATAQLLSEFDYYCSKDGGMQDLKLMVSRAKSGYYPDTLTGVSDLEPIRAVLHKHDGRIVYEHLVVLPVAPEHLDCFEVTVALFDILGQLYQKFMDDGCALPHVVDAMEAIDQKLKHIVYKPLTQSFAEVGVWKLQTQLGSVVSVYGQYGHFGAGSSAAPGKPSAAAAPTPPKRVVYYTDHV